MIRIRSTQYIPAVGENPTSVPPSINTSPMLTRSLSVLGSFSSLPRLLRMSSSQSVTTKSEEKDSPTKGSSVKAATIIQPPNKLWKYLIFILVGGILVYGIILNLTGANFGASNYKYQKPLYEPKEQLTVMINTFKRPDMLEGI